MIGTEEIKESKMESDDFKRVYPIRQTRSQFGNEYCPDCGSALYIKDGCWVCRFCGYSICYEKGKNITKEQTLGKALTVKDIETCQNCGNSYILVWTKEGDDFNDFGLRHCPFCGLLTDPLTGEIAV